MLKLKTFENFSNGSWQQLTKDEWINWIHNDLNRIDFTNAEIEQIRKLALELKPDNYDKWISDRNKPLGWKITWSEHLRGVGHIKSNVISMYVNDDCYISINKLQDEWFGILQSHRDQTYILDDDFRFYRCDQWSGLIEALKHIFEHA